MGRIRYGAFAFVTVLLGLWMRYSAPPASTDGRSWTSFSSKTSCRVFNQTLNNEEDGLKYCEDLIHWNSAGVAIVSCDGGRRGWNTVMGPLRNPNPRGKLWIYHLDRSLPGSPSFSQPNLYSLTLEGFDEDQDFHPIGLELFEYNKQSARLFVVNHRRDRSVVEVFELSAPVDQAQFQLTWHRTLVHPLLNTPNSIVALNQTSLLVTNDHFINRRKGWVFGPILHTFETLARLPGGNVISLDFDEHGKEQAQVEISAITFANGILLSPDRSVLFVSSSTTFKILFYRVRQGTDGRLTSFEYTGARKLPFGPDNLTLDPDHDLVVAGHPSAPRLFMFVYGEKLFRRAGSGIAHLNLREGGLKGDLKVVFADTGAFFGSSSTGVIIKESGRRRRLIASGLYHTGLLECIESE